MTTKEPAKQSVSKDVIYIDVDDEITAVIDKVQSSSSKIVALVLPKRAAVMQSIVNMKLLKRSAESANKRLVLVTTEAGVLPLAGLVGLHVASTPQSKPAIPPPPATDMEPAEIDSEVASLSDADTLPAAVTATAIDNDAPIEIDNDEKPVKPAIAAAGTLPLNKKLRVPNFNKFRTRLIAVGLLVVFLLIGWFVAFKILPKAVITVRTDSVNVASDLKLVASTEANEIDIENKIARATIQNLKKTDVQKVPATGREDRGTKASGTVTFTNCTNTEGNVMIPAGTGVSNGGVTFITQADVKLDEARYGPPGNVCRPGSGQIGQSRVVAQSNGDQANLSARAYNVAGFDSGLKAQGSDMSGGTSSIITVVSQADIDSARQKTASAGLEVAKQEIIVQSKASRATPLEATFASAEPMTTTAPGVGAEASEVTVTTVTGYTMLSVNSDDLKQFIETDIKSKINSGTQVILGNGLNQAIFKDIEQQRNKTYNFGVSVIGSAGVKQDEAEIRQAVKGKKKGDVETILNGRPGVREIEIKYSPFWVTRTPADPNKIKINFEQPTK